MRKRTGRQNSSRYLSKISLEGRKLIQQSCCCDGICGSWERHGLGRGLSNLLITLCSETIVQVQELLHEEAANRKHTFLAGRIAVWLQAWPKAKFVAQGQDEKLLGLLAVSAAARGETQAPEPNASSELRNALRQGKAWRGCGYK